MSKMILGYIKSPDDSRDKNAQDFIKVGALPEEYNCKKYLNSVVDQGSTPKCSAVAILVTKEWKEYIDNSNNVVLSDEFVFANRADKSLEGMTGRDTLSILKHKGVPTEQDYKLYKKDETKLAEASSKHKIQLYARVNTPEIMKASIMANGPVWIGLPVYSYETNFWNKSGALLGGHAVSVVGWDKTGFIIKNSWGTSYGSKGYATIPYNDFRCIMEAWTIIK